jgi:predicted DNA-binding transcriptional regulator YafY
MVAYVEGEGIRHFRVDKMMKIRETRDKRLGKNEFYDFDIAKYSKMNFGMFGGENKKVKIAFSNDLVGVFIDWFGKDIPIRPADKEGWSETIVEVAVSDQFYGWLFALMGKVKVIGPEEVKGEYKDKISEVRALY